MICGKMSQSATVEASSFATPEDCPCNRPGISRSDLNALCGFVVNPSSYDVFIHNTWDCGSSQPSAVTSDELSATLQQAISKKYQRQDFSLAVAWVMRLKTRRRSNGLRNQFVAIHPLFREHRIKDS